MQATSTLQGYERYDVNVSQKSQEITYIYVISPVNFVLSVPPVGMNVAVSPSL
jgi:hypothetical protein